MKSFFSCLFILLLLLSCDKPTNIRFQSLSSSKTKITFKNTVRETPEFNVLNYGYFYNGGGVAAGDINNDGLTDLYFTGNMKASHLYLNKGDFRFENIAEEAGVEAAGLWNTGVTMADVNVDGWLDIYVCRSAAKATDARRNLLFINNQDNTFTESATQYGLDDPGYSTQAAFFDYDRDGDLDAYILNHSVQEYAGFGKQLASLKQKNNPIYGDRLYRNEGGKFVDVSEEAGILSNVLGFGLGIAVADVNDDGWLDVYVTNDYNEHDYLYLNQQNGTFRESLKAHIDHTSLFSMGCDIGDINNDGFPEIFTLDMLPESLERQKTTVGADNFNKKQSLVQQGFHDQTMRNMLHLNHGNGSFSEIGQLANVEATDWSWAALFGDYDLDGFQDLFVTNGYKRDYTNMDFMAYAADLQIKSQAAQTSDEEIIQDLIANMPSIIEPNYLFQNQGNLRFENQATDWGLGEAKLSNGAVYADLDNDGDLDLVVNNVNEEASIYRNQTREMTEAHYLKIKLKGEGQNRFGIGAKVMLFDGDQQLNQTLMPTRGYQSAVEPILAFGLGEQTAIERIVVQWSNGQLQELKNVVADQLLTIEYSPQPNIQIASYLPPTFQVKTQVIDYQHIENNFNDFNQQPLLPFMLSTQGPAMSVGDVNGDGLEDVFFGGAKGDQSVIFLQNQQSQFGRGQLFDDVTSEATKSLFFDADSDGDLDVYVCYGGSEFEEEDAALQDRIYLNDGKGNFSSTSNLPEMLTSTASVAANDYDRDGDLDLFVGGRNVPGKYPKTPRSYLLENDGKGKFKIVTPDALKQIGMVTDAAWADLNGDAQVELIVVGDWMPITIVETQNWSVQTIENTNGLWRSLLTSDLDNDGDLDIVAGNIGENTFFEVTDNQTLIFHTSDFDKNGTLDPILGYEKNGAVFPLLYKDDLAQQLPSIKKDYLKYEDYAKASLADLLNKDKVGSTQQLPVNQLSHIYLENKGNFEFETRPLPLMSQIAPVHAILTADFNDDGHLDALLAGNFYENRVQFGAFDAGKGTLLLGDGKGDFTVVPNKVSGLDIQGSVRAMESLTLASGEEVILVAKNNGRVVVLGQTY
ncbi:MAG: VCBS repeat-containing protein [Bacteroidota bacterium]